MASKLDDYAISARAAGYTWDEIKQHLSTSRAEAIGAGYTDEEINAFLGAKNPDDTMPAIRAQAAATLKDNPAPEGAKPMGGFEAFLDGMRRSSGGLLAFGGGVLEEDQRPTDGMFSHIAQMVGGAVGDLPASAAGFFGGAAAGAAMTANPVGAAIGGGVGGFALPEHIKAQYADGVKNGKYQSTWDYASRQAAVWGQTAKAGATGAAMVAGGEVGLAAGATNIFARTFAQLGGEVAAMTVTAKALDGKLAEVTPEDFLDNAIMLGGFKTASAAVTWAPMLRDNLLDHWVKTDEKPMDATQRAMFDEAFREELTSPPQPETPKDATVVVTPTDGPLVVKPYPPEPEVGMHKEPLVMDGSPAMRKALNTLIEARNSLRAAGINPHDAGAVERPTDTPEIKALREKYSDASAQVADVRRAEPEEPLPAKFGVALSGVGRVGEAYGPFPVAANSLEPPPGVAPLSPNVAAALAKLPPGATAVVNGVTYTQPAPPPPAPKVGDFYDTRGQGAQFHGSKSTEALVLEEGHYTSLNYYGQGFYATDAVDVGFGYARKGKGTLYQIQPRADVKLLDMEQPVPEWLAKKINDVAEKGSDLDGLLADVLESKPANLRELYDEVRDAGTGEGLSADSIQEIFEGLREMIEAEGFEGLTHTGGLRTNTAAHKVSIYFDPSQSVIKTAAINPAHFQNQPAAPAPQAPVSPAAQAAAAAAAPPQAAVPPAPTAPTTGVATLHNPLGPNYTHLPTAAAAVNARMAPPISRAPLIERIGKAFRRIYLEMMNPNARIDKATNDLADALGHPVDELANPRILREVTRTSGERARLMVEKGMVDIYGDRSGPGLLEIIKPFENEVGLPPDAMTFWTYAISRWAIEKAQQAKETGVEVVAANTVVAAGHAKYGAAFDQLVEWQNGTLEYLQDAGVISKETFDKLVLENKARIPGYRDLETPAQVKGGGPGKIPSNPVKKMFGSEERVQDLLSSLISDAFIRVELANRARENRAAADVGIATGIATEEASTQARKFDVDLKEIEDLGFQQIQQGIELSIWRHLHRNAAPDETIIFRDGKVTYAKWSDPEVPEVLKGYDQATLSTIQKWVAAITRVQKNLITLAPDFAVRMKIYDIPQQFIVNPEFRNTFFEFINGFGHTLVRSDKWQDAVDRGVVADQFHKLMKDQYVQNVLKGREDPSFTSGIRNGLESAAKFPLKAARYWAGLFYQASEVGNLIARDRKNPTTPLTNAAEATQAAFPQPGYGGAHGRVVNMFQPFFTSYLNGLETTIRSQFGIGKTIGGKDFSPAAFAIKAAALVTAPVLAQYFLHKDDPWYKNAPEWQKDNGLLFAPIEPGGNPIFFKLPPVISFLYGALPRRIAAALNEQDANALSEGLGKSFAWSFAPPGGLITYNVAMPIVEKIANWSSHRDAPLNPAALSGPSGPQAPEKFYPWTSETAKTLALGMSNIPVLREFNLSPAEVDNFIRSWGGTIAPAIVTYAEKALGAKPEAPTAHWDELPGVSSFFARTTGISAQPVKDFGATMNAVGAVHASLGIAMADGNIDRFRDLVEKNPVAAVMSAPSFGISLRGINAAGNATANPEFTQILREAAARLDTDTVEELRKTDTVLGLMRTVTGLIESVENPTNRQAIEQIAEKVTGEGTGVTGPLSATDKRQLLDRYYPWMVLVAEHGNQIAAQLGVR